MVVVIAPSANVTATPANATGADNVATSNVAVGTMGLALRVANSRRVESATNSFTSRTGRLAPSQLSRTLSPRASIVSPSPLPVVLPPPTTISFDAARGGSYDSAAGSVYVEP